MNLCEGFKDEHGDEERKQGIGAPQFEDMAMNHGKLISSHVV